MTAHTWDGKKFVNEAGKPVFARYDKYGGCYVYEEDTPMTAHTINAPLVERYKELARDADETRRLENAASPSMQYLLIENNRVCAERDAALKELEVERAQNLTLRSWMAENNDYAKGWADGAKSANNSVSPPEPFDVLVGKELVGKEIGWTQGKHTPGASAQINAPQLTEQHAPLLRATRQKP